MLTPQITVDQAIVTTLPKSRKAALRELAQVIAELRREAKEKGIEKMTKRDINRAVAAARRYLARKSSKRPVK